MHIETVAEVNSFSSNADCNNTEYSVKELRKRSNPGVVYISTPKSTGRGPFKFSLGAGMVIKGWEEGVAGMKVGGKRKLIIPPDLCYGSRSMRSIPPNSILVFDIELLGVN